MAICDICRVAPNGSLQARTQAADGQVHVESLVSHAEPERDVSNDYRPMRKQPGSEGGDHWPQFAPSQPLLGPLTA